MTATEKANSCVSACRKQGYRYLATEVRTVYVHKSPIVSPTAEDGYHLKDPDFETKFNVNLPKRLSMPNRQKLFQV